MAKFVSMSNKPGMNALNTDFTAPGAGLLQAGITLDNLHKKWTAAFNDRANKKGGSKQLWDNLTRWTTTKNAQAFVKRYPQQAALFNKSVTTGKIQPGLKPATMMAALDWGMRENDRSQQHKSNFLDSVWGKLLGKLVQVGVGFIPGIGTPMAMAIGAGLGAAQSAAQTRPDGLDIALGGVSGGLATYGGVKLNEAITSAGGVGPYVNNVGTGIKRFVTNPIDTLTGKFSQINDPPLTNVNNFMPGDVASRAVTGASRLAGGAAAPGAGALIDGATGQVISNAPTVLDRAGNIIGGGMGWDTVLKAGTDILGTIFDNKTNDNNSAAIAAAAALENKARDQARQDLIKGQKESTALNKPGVAAYNNALGVLDPLLTKGEIKVNGKKLTVDQWMQKVDPGYRFRFGEGERALSTRQMAAGDRLSGRAQKELIRYGQGYASNEFGSTVNRLHNLAALGDTAVGRTSNTALGVGSDIAALTVATGENNANAALHQAEMAAQSRDGWRNTGVGIANSLIDRYRRSSSGSRFVTGGP